MISPAWASQETFKTPMPHTSVHIANSSATSSMSSEFHRCLYSLVAALLPALASGSELAGVEIGLPVREVRTSIKTSMSGRRWLMVCRMRQGFLGRTYRFFLRGSHETHWSPETYLTSMYQLVSSCLRSALACEILDEITDATACGSARSGSSLHLAPLDVLARMGALACSASGGTETIGGAASYSAIVGYLTRAQIRSTPLHLPARLGPCRWTSWPCRR